MEVTIEHRDPGSVVVGRGGSLLVRKDAAKARSPRRGRNLRSLGRQPVESRKPKVRERKPPQGGDTALHARTVSPPCGGLAGMHHTSSTG